MATEENSRGLAEGRERLFFLSVYRSGQSLLKWLCWVMALCRSKTFACCLKREENAFLPVFPRNTALTAFNSSALLPHENNEKVAEAECVSELV